MKYFFKLFLIVIGAEIALRLLILVLQLQPIHLLGSILSELSSFPLSLIDRSFPYWAMGSIGFSVSLVFITWFIHTVILFVFIKLIKTFERQD